MQRGWGSFLEMVNPQVSVQGWDVTVLTLQTPAFPWQDLAVATQTQANLICMLYDVWVCVNVTITLQNKI